MTLFRSPFAYLNLSRRSSNCLSTVRLLELIRETSNEVSILETGTKQACSGSENDVLSKEVTSIYGTDHSRDRFCLRTINSHPLRLFEEPGKYSYAVTRQMRPSGSEPMLS